GSGVVDEDRGPGAFSTGADADAVAARVVNEGHADAAEAAGGRQEAGGEAPPGAQHSPEEGGVDLDEVVPGEHLVGVGSGPDVDDRVVAVAVQFRVIPAASQVVAEVFVRGGAHPHGAVLPVLFFDQVDGDFLPVGLVVVDAAVDRPPVVHGVEEPVLQDDVTAFPHDTAVVGGGGAGVDAVAVAGGCGCCDPAGDGSSDEEGEPHQHVHDPAEDPDRGEASAFRDDGPFASAEAACFGPQRRFLDESQVLAVARPFGVGAGEPVEGEFPGGDDFAFPAFGKVQPQTAAAHVGFDVRGEEQLPPGEHQHGFVGAQQFQVSFSAHGRA